MAAQYYLHSRKAYSLIINPYSIILMTSRMNLGEHPLPKIISKKTKILLD